MSSKALLGAQSEVSALFDGETIGERRFLFLGGPFGPFTAQLAAELRAQGAMALRVILHGGDRLDWGWRHAATFRASPEAWPGWIRMLLRTDSVSDLILFGSRCPYAREARAAALEIGLRVHVFEEGYLRPGWITLDRGGVNGESALMTMETDPPGSQPTLEVQRPAPVRDRLQMAAAISAHLMAQWACAPYFPNYRSPYRPHPLWQAALHVARLPIDLLQAVAARMLNRPPGAERAGGRLFVVLLQRPGDSQLVIHSSYPTLKALVDTVVASFRTHAPDGYRLIIRPHPLDPGLEPMRGQIRRLALRTGLGDRLTYQRAGALTDWLQVAAGVVCVNSTAGLAALQAGVATLTLGRSVYDRPGLTHQGGLDAFWTQPEPPRPEHLDAFLRVLIARTQIAGGFYREQGRRSAIPAITARLLHGAA